MSVDQLTIEAEVWDRVIHSDHGTVPPEVARFLAGLAFEESDLVEMHQLATLHQEEALTSESLQRLQGYRRVGLVLDLLRSKARLSLKTGTH